jgi:2-octaprenyl-6-methoxyphenol hydroxylase
VTQVAIADIAVVGAGPVGLAAALTFGQLGFNVAIVAPKLTASAVERDTRTAALLLSSVQMLQNLGLWATVEGEAAPLVAIRMVDDRGGVLRAPEILFRAEELGLPSFGANIANATLVAALGATIARSPQIRWLSTQAATRIVPRVDDITLVCAEGSVLTARLVVAADGRNSTARAAAGIDARTWHYPQTAIAATFSHRRPHANVSTEFHRPAGPLTTVPTPGLTSSLVWVEQPSEAQRLGRLADQEFSTALEERLQGLLGLITGVGPRMLFPLNGLMAERFARHRVVLVGEAAHVVPPIGAQGLNLGFRDVAALADVLVEAREKRCDFGAPELIAVYDRARRTEISSSVYTIDVLNRSLLSDLVGIEIMRGAMLHLLALSAPLRRAVMQVGLGRTSHHRLMAPPPSETQQFRSGA